MGDTPGTASAASPVTASASDGRYRALFSAVQEGLLIASDEGYYVEVNEAYARLLKTTPEVLTGRHFSDFIPPDRLGEAEAAFASLKSEGRGLPDFPLRAVDGTVVECEWTFHPHFQPGLTLCSAREITGRKLAESALRASEARFRAAVSAISSLLWTNSADGRMESEQPGWAEFTGQNYNEYRGFGWANAVHPDDAQSTLNAWNRAVSERRMFVFEHRVRRHDGVYRHFSIRAVPVFDEVGAIREWVGVHTDITEERELTNRLRESEARFRTMADSAPVLIWMMNAAKESVWFNRSWLEFTGRSMEQELGSGWTRGIHPDDYDRCLRAYEEAFDRRESFQFDYRLRRHDGEWRWLLDSGIPLFSSDGSLNGYIGSCIDVTDRRRAEEALRESENRLRAIFDGTYEYIGLLSPDGTVLEANRASLEFGNSSRDEIVNKKFWEAPWFSGTPGAADVAREGVRRAAAGEFVRYEAALTRPSGETPTFDISLHPIRDDQGQVVLIVPEGRNISERKHAEAMLRDREERLRLAQSAAGIGLWEWDLKADTVSWSPEVFGLLGVDPETMPSLDSWKQRVHPDDAQLTLDAAQRAIRTGEPLDAEFRLLHADGEVRWILSRASVYMDQNGQVVRLLGLNMDITEQKRAEQRTTLLVRLDDATRTLSDPQEITRAAATLLGEHLEANRCAYAEVQSDGDTVRLTGDFNRGVSTIVGRYALGQFGRSCRELMRAGEAYVVEDSQTDERVEAVRDLYAGTETRAIICVPLHKQGRLVAVMAVHQKVPRRWRQDEVDLVRAVAERCCESIERARAQSELGRQRKLFDVVLSNIPDLITTFDREGRFTYANSALLQVWGKSVQDIIGKNTFDLGYPPDLAPRIQHAVAEVIATGKAVRNFTPFTGVDGDSRTYECIFSPVVTHDGVVDAVTCTARDQTDRERMERALAESKARLQQVFVQAPVAIAVFRGPEYVFELANPYYQQLLRNRELVGRRFVDAVPEIRHEVRDALEHVMQTGEPFSATDWHVPYDADADGQVEDHWFNVVYHALREADGSVSGLVAVLSEVTAQVLARKRLEQANRELEEFAYVASHDLQEPLRMIGIYSQLLVKRFGGEDERAHQYGTFVEQGVQRMERLIRDLLSYSRIVHHDEREIRFADLNKSLEQAAETMRGKISETGARLTASPLPSVRGDETQIALIFQNLLSNSLKYLRRDVAPEIQIRAGRQGDEWVISVSDNGMGFQQQYADRIFGLFKRLHRDEYSGTGLGLAICQRIAERYGGRMWAEGRPGEGATFYIAFAALEEQ